MSDTGASIDAAAPARRRPIVIHEAEEAIRELEGCAAALHCVFHAHDAVEEDRALAVLLLARTVEARTKELGRLVLNDGGPKGGTDFMQL